MLLVGVGHALLAVQEVTVEVETLAVAVEEAEAEVLMDQAAQEITFLKLVLVPKELLLLGTLLN
jgi:hypothetical protein